MAAADLSQARERRIKIRERLHEKQLFLDTSHEEYIKFFFLMVVYNDDPRNLKQLLSAWVLNFFWKQNGIMIETFANPIISRK